MFPQSSPHFVKVTGIALALGYATIRSVNPLALRTALITGLLIGIVNVLFAGWQAGFHAVPLWFYLCQLLLLPAMVIPMQLFPQAALTRSYLQRAGLFALGWAVPYAIYKFSGDALNLGFDPVASFTTYLIAVALFGVVFAAIRAPKAPK